MNDMLGSWQLDVKAVRERMHGAPTARERERWHAIWLLAPGWSAAQVAMAASSASSGCKWSRMVPKGGEAYETLPVPGVGGARSGRHGLRRRVDHDEARSARRGAGHLEQLPAMHPGATGQPYPVQRLEKAQRPWKFEEALSGPTYGDSLYFGSTVDQLAAVSLRTLPITNTITLTASGLAVLPVPCPTRPGRLWCVRLGGGETGPQQVLFVALHEVFCMSHPGSCTSCRRTSPWPGCKLNSQPLAAIWEEQTEVIPA